MLRDPYRQREVSVGQRRNQPVRGDVVRWLFPKQPCQLRERASVV